MQTPPAKKTEFKKCRRCPSRRLIQRCLKFIDGIRGVLALLVLVDHVSGNVFGWWGPGHFAQNAHLAVDAFFVMSGFILSAIYVESTFVQYFLKRFERLWPLHIVAMTAFIGISLLNRAQGVTWPQALGYNIPSILNIFCNVFMLNAVGLNHVTSIVPAAWSVSVELYVSSILIPILVRAPKAVGFIFASIGYGTLFFVHGNLLNTNNVFSFFNRGLIHGLAAIALGASIFKSLPKPDSIAPSAITEFLTCSAAVMFIIYIFQTGHHSDFLAVVIFAMMFTLIWGGGAPKFRSFLSGKFFVFLGDISYPLYLMHFPVILFVQYRLFGHMQNKYIFIITIAFSFVVAWITLQLERKIRRYTKPLFQEINCRVGSLSLVK